jgi:tetratricopeptide (TPR) repeat protein
MRQKDYGAAITYRRETVELGLATPDLELAFDLASLGLTMSSARQPRDAVVSYLEQAERLTHGSRHLKWRGPLLRTLGNELVSLGRVAEAEPILIEAVRLARTANERGGLVTALIGQQVLALVSGRPAEARTLGLEALEQARTLQQPATVAVLLNNLATASLDAGDLNAAERYLAEVDTLTDAMPSFVQAHILGTRAQFELSQGNFETARAVAIDAAQLRETIGQVTVFPKIIIGRAYVREGNLEHGIRLIAEARANVSGIIDQRALADAIDDLAEARARAGLDSEATLHREDAARLRSQRLPPKPVDDALLGSVQKVLVNRDSVKPQTRLFLFVYYRSYGLWALALLLILLPLQTSTLLIAGKAVLLSAAVGVYVWGKSRLQAGRSV